MKEINQDTVIHIIKLYQEGQSCNKIGDSLNLSHSGIRKVLIRNNIKMRNSGTVETTKEIQDKIIELYNTGLTLAKVGEQVSLGPTSIMRILKRNNIPIRSKSVAIRKYNINENFLDNIDTQEKAYFLGFFYADGCNLPKTREIVISLHPQDIDILKIFSAMFYTDNPEQHLKLRERSIHNKITKICTLRINSVYLSNRLIELGCPQAKTFKLKFPDWMPEILLPHFIRGYFDGDGSIYPKGNSFGWKIISTEDFLKGILSHFERILQVKIPIYPSSSIFTIHTSGKFKIQKIMDWLYKDATIYLQRKYNKYHELNKNNG